MKKIFNEWKIIRMIERERISSKTLFDINLNEQKYLNIVPGEIINLWYLSKESEDGTFTFQIFKGLCTLVKHNDYKTTFYLRNVIDTIWVEQQFFFYSAFLIKMETETYRIKFYKSNRLFFLRKKANKYSKFILDLKY